MLISVDHLPSGGFGANSVSIVSLVPMTYSEVLDYISGPTYKCDSIGQFRWDIEYVLSKSVNGYQDISAYDSLFVISIRKLISVLNKNKFTLRGKSYSVEDVTFTNISDEMRKLCKIGDYPFRMPTIGEIERKLMGIEGKYYDRPLELIILATGMDVSLDTILNLPADMIPTIEYVKSMVVAQPKVKGGEEDIILFEKSSDLFRILLESKGDDKIKVEFTQDVSDGDSE